MPQRTLKKVKNPRMSANELALYMVSSDVARIGIIQRAREPKPYIVARYRDSRQAVCRFLADRHRSLAPLVDTENMLNQRIADPARTNKQKEDASLSIEVLHAIQAMQNKLAKYDFHPPPRQQKKLYFSGVEISVKADLLVYGRTRGVDQIGAAILRMGKDDAQTDDERARRRELGLFVATLAHMHVQQNCGSGRAPRYSLSMSIDIQHGEVFLAPLHRIRRTSNMKAACRSIAAMWDLV